MNLVELGLNLHVCRLPLVITKILVGGDDGAAHSELVIIVSIFCWLDPRFGVYILGLLDFDSSWNFVASGLKNTQQLFAICPRLGKPISYFLFFFNQSQLLNSVVTDNSLLDLYNRSNESLVFHRSQIVHAVHFSL